MAQFPSDLEPDNTIIFGYGDMPSKPQQAINYSTEKANFSPKGAIALPLPSNMEETSSHNYDLTEGVVKQGVEGIVNAVPGNTVKKIYDLSKNTLDPNYFYAYINSNPRSFTYNIVMVPRTENEAKEMMDIILKFKKFSSPIRFGGVDIKNHLWTININNYELYKATRYDKKFFVLTSVTTNYTASGSALFYEDGMPKSTSLSLTFSEQGVMYEDDWDS